MTRDEWNAYAESVPLTPDQRGSILGHCNRLGLADRPERLAVLAALLDLDELESTADLTLGQAGRLVNLLQRTRERAELPEMAPAVADDGQDDERDAVSAEPVTLPEALMQIAVILWQLFGPGSKPAESGDLLPASEEITSGD